jgi:hypothetical protein
MQNLKPLGYLFIVLASVFVLGLYASSTFRYNEPVEEPRWVVTSLVGLTFLIMFLTDYRKKN